MDLSTLIDTEIYMILKLIPAALVVVGLAACSPNTDVAPQSKSRTNESTATPAPALPVTEQAAAPAAEQAAPPAAEQAVAPAPAAEAPADAPAAMPTQGSQQ
jgi:uncharacterized lipoprotein